MSTELGFWKIDTRMQSREERSCALFVGAEVEEIRWRRIELWVK